jgi:hypothetical protein
MNKIKKHFEAGTLKKEVLLLEKDNVVVASIPDEVEELATKYDDFGINNSTVAFINKSRSDIATKTVKNQQARIKEEGLQLLIGLMFPFKIIPYKVMHEVANDYNLVISNLSYYNMPIAEENVEELQVFKELMAEKRDHFQRLCFPKGSKFMFAERVFDSVEEINFANYFNIVAPKSHFDFKGDNVLQIGREIKKHEKSPTFEPNLKFHVPEPTDPIIVAPFVFLGKTYGFVVTAWDEVADDRRIRSMIK